MKNLVVKSVIVFLAFFFFSNSSFSAIDTKSIDDLFDQNKLNEIEKTINKLELTPLTEEKQAQILIFKAKLSLEKNKFSEAFDYATNAIKIIPNDRAKLKVQANLIIAAVFFIRKDITNCLSLLDLSEQECLNLQLKEELADIYSFKGLILQVIGKDNDALIMFGKALSLYKEIFDIKKIIDVQLLMAGSLNNLAKFDQSMLLIKTIQEKNLQLKNPKIEAKIYIALSATFFAKGEFDKSLEYSDKAIIIANQLASELLLVDANTWKGLILIGTEDFNQAEQIYLKSLEIQIKHFGDDHPATAMNYSSLAIVYSKKTNYSKALEMALKANSIFKKSYGDAHPVTANSYNQLAELYNKLGYDKKALEYYYIAINNLQSVFGKDHINNAFIYNSIASVFYKQHKYNEALDWYNKALLLTDKYFKNDHLYNSKLYSNIALCFYNLDDYDKALEYLNKSLNIINNQKTLPNIQTVIGHSNLGSIYEKQGKYNDAIDTYLKAIQIIETNNLSAHPAAAIAYEHLANVYKMVEMYDKALYYYEDALTINQKVYKEDNPAIINGYNNIATVYDDLKSYDLASNYYNKALKLSKISKNDDYSGILNSNLGYLNQKQKKYSQAINYYKDSLKHFNSIINYSAVKQDTYNLASSNLSLNENIVKCLIQVKKPQLALYYSDMSRYQDLVNSMSYKKALLASVIDKSDFNKLEEIENNYKKTQSLCLNSSIDNQLMDDQNSIIGKANNSYCQDETFLRKQLTDYVSELDLKYPQFYKKRFNNLTSPSKLQTILANKELHDTAIIEYYLAYDNLYIFIIFNGTVQVITSNYCEEDIANLVKQYNKPFRFVSLAPTSGLMIDILKKYDLKTSYELYKILLEEPLNKLKTIKGFNEKTNLIIIPHKSLYYLSFESLITKDIQKLQQKNDIAFSEYLELPYFINDYKISYLPNLSFFEFIHQYIPQLAIKEDNMLIIGNPDLTLTKKHNKAAQNLKQLPYSETEAKVINSILGTQSDLIIGDKATEKIVDSKIGQYNNYHFACHGILNDKEPLYSGLVLSRESDVLSSEQQKPYDGILYAYEIINKQIKANLVVLSACDSALGKLQSGEGMLGLTNAFLIAGANSLVITLWKINDESSSIFMKEFYTQLNANNDQNALELLRNAKLNLMKTTNTDFKSGKYKGISYSHPYFWAPFIYNGY